MRIALFFLAAVSLSGTAAACPFADLKRGTAIFETAKGRFTYKVELALTSQQQACGLMFREKMAPAAGMAFPMNPPKQAAFWMENTILPLDIIFVSPAGRVLNVLRGEPYSRALLPAAGITGEVIELNAGEAERIGLKPGDRVRRK
ncbi:DUF192 domain-containing protein [Sandarakinorhabdus rubra]|uniref:DUF192 domain-containing protein n=1 Tax=Sandarakinorhabdus rubra TaxID=2672568 RepID=UPI0013DA7BB1|nr:DUF192 domain-containing protein [Sandarakinorhabdus rubra]